MYVFDIMRRAGVKVFDISGKYIYDIGKRGEGPDDVQYVQKFRINPFTTNVELLGIGGKLDVFDRKTAKKTSTLYLSEKNYSVKAVDDFIALNKTDYAFYSFVDYPNNIVLYDGSNDEAHVYNLKVNPKIAEMNYMVSSDAFGYLADKTVVLNVYYERTVFKFNGKAFEPFFIRDYTEKYNHMENYIIKTGTKRNITKNLKSNSDKFVSYFSLPYITDKHILFTASFNNIRYQMIYDKEIGKSSMFPLFKEGIKGYFGRGNYGYIYLPVSYSKLKDYVNEKVLDAKNMEILKNIKEDDNPVVLRYKLKDF